MKILLLSFIVCSISLPLKAQDRDSLRLKLESLFNREIVSDSLAYYEGFAEAQNYPRLAIRSVGDPGHVSTCEYYAYERYGVYLEMTGDIIYDNSIFDRNKGFNSVMTKRIQDSIPQWLDSIGNVNENWIEFDHKVMLEFIKLFDFEILSDSSALVTLNPDRIEESLFENLEGIEISDARTKQLYDYEVLINGAIFEVKGTKSYRGYMKLNFENCPNPNYICTGRLTLPFTINTE
jgi:hypothetical protein